MQLNIFLLFLLVLVKGDDQPLYQTLIGVNAIGNYSDSNYRKANRIQRNDFEIHTIGDNPNQPIGNAFDDNRTTFWAGNVSVTEGNPYPLTFNFSKLQSIEAIIYMPAYSTNYNVHPNTRLYGGFPLVLKVYISIGDSPYQLKYIFNTNPKNTDIWDAVQMVFTKPIWCDSLKIEFVNVTFNNFFGNIYTPAIQDIYLMKAKFNNTKKANADLFEKKIPSTNFSYETAGDQSDHPITYAFNSNTSQFWAAQNPNNESFNNYLIFTFREKFQFINSVAYWAAYSTNRDVNPNTRRYDGFPLQLSIYASTVGDNYELVYLHNGIPTETSLWDAVHFQFDQPILCYKLKLVFEYVTKDVSFGGELTPAAMQIAVIPPEEEATTSKPFEVNGTETPNEGMNVNIDNAKFANIIDINEYGGACLIVERKVNITNSEFTNCSSTIAGGAVYLNTQRGTDTRSLNYQDLTFTNCSSHYGGAMCIIAKLDTDFTQIIRCHFTQNRASNDGSAIYLCAKHGIVKSCTFSQQTGSSIIKYSNSEPANSVRSLTATTLTSCDFAISDCCFEDDITEGSFYIDVDESLDSKGISLKNNKFKSNDIKQTIKINQSPIQHERKSKSSLFLTILVPTLCVISLLLISFIIFEHKNKNQQSEQEENHNEKLTQDEV